MRFCLDYLGGANYSELIISEHPEGWGAGFILNTNKPSWKKSNAWPVIEMLARSGRCPLIKVHAVWEDNHTYNSKKHDGVIEREFKKCLELANRFIEVEFQFSWFCENNMTAAQNQQMVKRYNGSRVTLVNSIWKGAVVAGAVTEVHGDHAPARGPYNYSFDGKHCFDANTQKLKEVHGKCLNFFFWFSQCNGRWSADSKKDPTPRNQRKAWPYAKLLDSAIYLHRNKGETRLRGNNIWKTHADQHGPVPDNRANKPVLISPSNVREVTLVTDNGQVVGKASNAGVFNDGSGRRLYRFSEWGMDMAEKARRIQGHSVVKIMANGKSIGTVNPAFRDGSFR